MGAIQITTTGGPEVLQVRDVSDPVPNRGEVLIRVHASGVNFIDVYYREGKYKAPFPSFQVAKDPATYRRSAKV